jgi:hypothetical protein
MRVQVVVACGCSAPPLLVAVSVVAVVLPPPHAVNAVVLASAAINTHRCRSRKGTAAGCFPGKRVRVDMAKGAPVQRHRVVCAVRAGLYGVRRCGVAASGELVPGSIGRWRKCTGVAGNTVRICDGVGTARRIIGQANPRRPRFFVVKRVRAGDRRNQYRGEARSNERDACD